MAFSNIIIIILFFALIAFVVFKTKILKLTGDTKLDKEKKESPIVTGTLSFDSGKDAGFAEEKALHAQNVKKIPPLCRVPQAPAGFVGRQKEIDEILGIGGKGVIISGGASGLGKTSLALKVTPKLSPQFPDAQIFIHMRGSTHEPLTPAEAMAIVIRTRHSYMKLPDDERELGKTYHSLLEGGKMLIILDDVENRNHVQPLIPSESCYTIITCNESFTLAGFHNIDLKPLEMKEAKKLLSTLHSKIGVMEEELAKICDFIPMPLCITGALLAHVRGVTPLQFSTKLQNKKNMLEQITADKEDKCIEALLKLGYAEMSKKTASVLCRLSIFSSSFDSKAEEHVCEDSSNSQLSKLVELKLVTHDEVGKRFRLHNIVRQFAAGYLTKGELATAQTRHAEHYLKVIEQAAELASKDGKKSIKGLHLFDLEWENIRTAYNWAKENMVMEKDAAAYCCRYPEAGRVFLEHRLSKKNRLQWLETALSAAKQMKDSKAEQVQLVALGDFFLESGSPLQALELYKQAHEIARHLATRTDEMRLLDSIGLCFAKLNNHMKAADYFQQALDKKTGDASMERNVLVHMGKSFSALGSHRKSMGFYEQALAIDRQTGNRHDEGESLWLICQALAQNRNMVEAIDRAQEAIALLAEFKRPEAAKAKKQLEEWKEKSNITMESLELEDIG